MARKKKQTTKSTRNSVTLDSVFTGIANAIRAKTGGSDPIFPRNMGNAIRGIKNVTEASLPEANLPAVFQDIADAIRACGITGTMTANQMAGKIGDIVAGETKLRLVVQTDSTYKKSGIYSATRDDTSKPVVIDWGDGTVEQVDGDISQKVHTYSTVGTFNIVVENIKKYAASTTKTTWYNTTSQNKYTLKEVVIPDSVTSIESHAFVNCSGLTNVTIGNNVTTIPTYAFSNCSSLTSVTIGNGVTNIGNGVFRGCRGLTSVTIPNSVTSIGSSAFSGCSGLTSVTIPNSVTSIGSSAFMNCKGLTSVTFVGKLSSQVTGMTNFSWELPNGCVVIFTNGTITIGDSGQSGGSDN